MIVNVTSSYNETSRSNALSPSQLGPRVNINEQNNLVIEYSNTAPNNGALSPSTFRSGRSPDELTIANDTSEIIYAKKAKRPNTIRFTNYIKNKKEVEMEDEQPLPEETDSDDSKKIENSFNRNTSHEDLKLINRSSLDNKDNLMSQSVPNLGKLRVKGGIVPFSNAIINKNNEKINQVYINNPLSKFTSEAYFRKNLNFIKKIQNFFRRRKILKKINLKKIIRIQSHWRGYFLRLKLFYFRKRYTATLMMFRKMRSVVRKVRRNVFNEIFSRYYICHERSVEEDSIEEKHEKVEKIGKIEDLQVLNKEKEENLKIKTLFFNNVLRNLFKNKTKSQIIHKMREWNKNVKKIEDLKKVEEKKVVEKVVEKPKEEIKEVKLSINNEILKKLQLKHLAQRKQMSVKLILSNYLSRYRNNILNLKISELTKQKSSPTPTTTEIYEQTEEYQTNNNKTQTKLKSRAAPINNNSKQSETFTEYEDLSKSIPLKSKSRPQNYNKDDLKESEIQNYNYLKGFDFENIIPNTSESFVVKGEEKQNADLSSFKSLKNERIASIHFKYESPDRSKLYFEEEPIIKRKQPLSPSRGENFTVEAQPKERPEAISGPVAEEEIIPQVESKAINRTILTPLSLNIELKVNNEDSSSFNINEETYSNPVESTNAPPKKKIIKKTIKRTIVSKEPSKSSLINNCLIRLFLMKKYKIDANSVKFYFNKWSILSKNVKNRENIELENKKLQQKNEELLMIFKNNEVNLRKNLLLRNILNRIKFKKHSNLKKRFYQWKYKTNASLVINYKNKLIAQVLKSRARKEDTSLLSKFFNNLKTKAILSKEAQNMNTFIQTTTNFETSRVIEITTHHENEQIIEQIEETQIQTTRQNEEFDNIKAIVFRRIMNHYNRTYRTHNLQHYLRKWNMNVFDVERNISNSLALSMITRTIKKINNRLFLSNFFEKLKTEAKFARINKAIVNLYNRHEIQNNKLIRSKFYKWMGPRAPHKIRVADYIKSFKTSLNDLEKLFMQHKAKKFFTFLKSNYIFLSHHANSSTTKSITQITYHLKNGEVVHVTRPKISYFRRLFDEKYNLFTMFRQKLQKMKEKELQSQSKKWTLAHLQLTTELRY